MYSLVSFYKMSNLTHHKMPADQETEDYQPPSEVFTSPLLVFSPRG